MTFTPCNHFRKLIKHISSDPKMKAWIQQVWPELEPAAGPRGRKSAALRDPVEAMASLLQEGTLAADQPCAPKPIVCCTFIRYSHSVKA